MLIISATEPQSCRQKRKPQNKKPQGCNYTKEAAGLSRNKKPQGCTYKRMSQNRTPQGWAKKTQGYKYKELQMQQTYYKPQGCKKT